MISSVFRVPSTFLLFQGDIRRYTCFDQMRSRGSHMPTVLQAMGDANSNCAN